MNFTIRFINWLQKAWLAIGPMYPLEGATVPLTQSALQNAYVLDVYGQGIPPTVVTAASYAEYLTEWAAQWETLHPGTPVPGQAAPTTGPVAPLPPATVPLTGPVDALPPTSSAAAAGAIG